jgi:ABC-type arginine/histidine transport system permease subunit
MLESVVELLGGLLLSALTLLIGSCIVGSIVAALLAVSRENATVNTRR